MKNNSQNVDAYVCDQSFNINFFKPKGQHKEDFGSGDGKEDDVNDDKEKDDEEGYSGDTDHGQPESGTNDNGVQPSDIEEGNEDEDEDEDEEPEFEDYPSDWEDATDYPGGTAMTTESLSTHIALGTAPTTNVSSRHASSSANGSGTGRVLSFPNWIQVRIYLPRL